MDAMEIDDFSSETHEGFEAFRRPPTPSSINSSSSDDRDLGIEPFQTCTQLRHLLMPLANSLGYETTAHGIDEEYGDTDRDEIMQDVDPVEELSTDDATNCELLWGGDAFAQEQRMSESDTGDFSGSEPEQVAQYLEVDIGVLLPQAASQQFQQDWQLPASLRVSLPRRQAKLIADNLAWLESQPKVLKMLTHVLQSKIDARLPPLSQPCSCGTCALQYLDLETAWQSEYSQFHLPKQMGVLEPGTLLFDGATPSTGFVKRRGRVIRGTNGRPLRHFEDPSGRKVLPDLICPFVGRCAPWRVAMWRTWNDNITIDDIVDRFFVGRFIDQPKHANGDIIPIPTHEFLDIDEYRNNKASYPLQSDLAILGGFAEISYLPERTAGRTTERQSPKFQQQNRTVHNGAARYRQKFLSLTTSTKNGQTLAKQEENVFDGLTAIQVVFNTVWYVNIVDCQLLQPAQPGNEPVRHRLPAPVLFSERVKLALITKAERDEEAARLGISRDELPTLQTPRNLARDKTCGLAGRGKRHLITTDDAAQVFHPSVAPLPSAQRRKQAQRDQALRGVAYWQGWKTDS